MTQHATWKHVLAWTATAIGGITIISGAFSSHLFLRDLFLGAAILLPGVWWLYSEKRSASSTRARRWPLIVILSALMLLLGVLLTPAAEKGGAAGGDTPATSTVTITTATPSAVDSSPSASPAAVAETARPESPQPEATRPTEASQGSPKPENHQERKPRENHPPVQEEYEPARVSVTPKDAQTPQRVEEEHQGPREITYIEETIYEEVVPGELVESEPGAEPGETTQHYVNCKEGPDGMICEEK
ncbi:MULTISPECIES: hypothetical protein [unclassified Corynebacterium]|uniref:hypothetical protein n=1 Tax=unclassified Corynebacterium TaxID=2624378 RepID=UPI0029CAA90D|nr:MULTISPECIES: hypothetical protein [unclassified Corynebacterium]WPF67068.1 hypothetical protein OLX12_04940 [Corynebacterium sp. 22KM0430]WPF69556.1 hypothetical protein OLW90_04935 [Corynebacterium sp. 21KM1197]